MERSLPGGDKWWIKLLILVTVNYVTMVDIVVRISYFIPIVFNFFSIRDKVCDSKDCFSESREHVLELAPLLLKISHDAIIQFFTLIFVTYHEISHVIKTWLIRWYHDISLWETLRSWIILKEVCPTVKQFFGLISFS